MFANITRPTRMQLFSQIFFKIIKKSLWRRSMTAGYLRRMRASPVIKQCSQQKTILLCAAICSAHAIGEDFSNSKIFPFVSFVCFCSNSLWLRNRRVLLSATLRALQKKAKVARGRTLHPPRDNRLPRSRNSCNSRITNPKKGS
jgi:hypothetical protein